jgi:hypothetical protein
MNDKSLSKLVKTNPSVFSCGIDETLEPKLAWLQERLVLDDKSASKLFLTLPPVLGCSIENNLEPKVAWVVAQLSSSRALRLRHRL